MSAKIIPNILLGIICIGVFLFGTFFSISPAKACTVPYVSSDFYNSFTVNSSKEYSGSLYYDENKVPALGTKVILTKDSYQIADKKYHDIKYEFNCYDIGREGEIIPKFLTLHWGVSGGTNPVYTMDIYKKDELVAEIEVISKNEIWLLEYGWIFSLVRND